MRIFKHNELEYSATSKVGLRAAVADALAAFLVNERQDIHDFRDHRLYEAEEHD